MINVIFRLISYIVAWILNKKWIYIL